MRIVFTSTITLIIVLVFSACSSESEFYKLETANYQPDEDVTAPVALDDIESECQNVNNPPYYITVGGKQFSKTLVELDLSGMLLTDEDVSQLRYMTSLTHLNLSANDITDLSPLADLTKLTHLHLNDNPISCIEPLSELHNMSFLNLSNTLVNDWAPVEHVAVVLGRQETETDCVIYGDLYFDGIALWRVFVEPFLDVLGEPEDESGAWFNFHGLSIMSTAPRGFENFENAVAIQVNIWPYGFRKLEVNGITLDNTETRADVVALLGTPYVSLCSLLGYRVFYPPREYRLFFDFISFDGEQYIAAIRVDYLFR